MEEKKEKDGNSSGKKINIFKEDLEFSEKASEEDFWQQIYKKAFPNMVNNMQCKGNNQGQMLGIDRIIYLKSGKELRIDEKKRRENWDDIILEYEHINDDGNKTPGWIEKDLFIDYLAYAFMPKKLVYLFPWEMLKRAWLKYKIEWKWKYPIPPAKNEGYETYNVAVPINVLRQAVSSATIIQL